MAVEKDIVDKSGSWYSYGDERIGQGRENAKQYLEDNPEKREEIYKKVRAAYGMDETAEEKDEEEEQKKTKAKEKAKGKAKKEKSDPSKLDLEPSDKNK